MGNGARGGFGAFYTSEKCNLGLQKINLGSKRPISESYELNLAIWGLFRLGNSVYVPFFWSISWEMWTKVVLKYFRLQQNKFLASRKSIWGPQRPISASYELNLAIWCLFRLGNSLYGPFFWSMPWRMWPEVDLKHFRHRKNIFGL